MYSYGLIGNCQTSALINHLGSIDWLCMPRPDSPPVFGKLLDAEGGAFQIMSGNDPEASARGEQSYLPHTPVLVTTVTDREGNAFRITDFCPRFLQHGRMYRPIALFRKVEPVAGSPTIRVSCRPVNGWEKTFAKPVRGNSHLRWEFRDEALRLVTNMPLTYLVDETPFALKESLYFGLSWSFGIEDDVVSLTDKFLSQTVDYWHTWVKHCSLPTRYQKETIRSALTLKLHCYEDTGAILAALTTSLPEQMGSNRNWDYRFCWLRDAYFVLTAFHNLGHFEEMEGFLKFILNIAEKHELSRERLRPVYSLDQSLPLPELEHGSWTGFHGSRPVRSGNQAAEHIQNDVYGEMILALAPIFFDERFYHLRTREHEGLMARLGRFCVANISKADAGLWEIRDGWQEHSFSNLMCWAGLERLERIHALGFLGDFDINLRQEKERAERAVRAAVLENSLRNGPHDPSLDSALLQLGILRFPDHDISRGTIDRIRKDLSLGGPDFASSFLYRYLRQDDFGTPDSAFLICSFWLVQALARSGDLGAAQVVMQESMESANQLGLFSEHYFPKARRQSGNFPQAYSHVGQINAAFAVSPPWTEVL